MTMRTAAGSSRTPRLARAFTLLELLLVVGITTIVSLAVARAYEQGITYDQVLRQGRERLQTTRLFEDRIEALLSEAYVTSLATDTDTCFIGDMGQSDPNAGGSLQLPGAFATNLTFTSFGGRLPSRVVDSKDDFETLNDHEGPQGGLAEISLSMTPVGQPPEVGGLYLRTQRPADSDPTQGGLEEQLNADVTEIEFEFYDGTTWQPTWDTRTMTTKRIPAVVRVTYRLSGSEDDHIFTVRLPHSDVTVDNPIQEGA